MVKNSTERDTNCKAVGPTWKKKKVTWDYLYGLAAVSMNGHNPLQGHDKSMHSNLHMQQFFTKAEVIFFNKSTEAKKYWSQ
jgi:hypothetical protein